MIVSAVFLDSYDSFCIYFFGMQLHTNHLMCLLMSIIHSVAGIFVAAKTLDPLLPAMNLGKFHLQSEGALDFYRHLQKKIHGLCLFLISQACLHLQANKLPGIFDRMFTEHSGLRRNSDIMSFYESLRLLLDSGNGQ